MLEHTNETKKKLVAVLIRCDLVTKLKRYFFRSATCRHQEAA